MLGLILFFESTRKSLRTIGELSFLNKYIALTEISLIFLYVILFWGAYFYGYKPNLFFIFIPHLIQSIIAVIIFSWLLINKIYKVIPNNQSEHIPSSILLKQMVVVRFSNYTNQLSHLLFSGNFLIPFLASNFGLALTAVFKLINFIAIYFTFILERTFGYTSGALLSHLKDSTTNFKQDALNFATKKLFIILYGILIFLIINSKTLFSIFITPTNISWIAIYFFLIAIVFENFFITYEQFFIVEKKVYYFTIVNLMTALIFYNSIYFMEVQLTLLLLLLLIARIFAYMILKQILIHKLKIKLNYKIDLNLIMIFFVISIISFIVLNFF